MDGRTRLLDEVDAISGVSGGSFTAAYYGLFKERIFEDFQDKFLKKDIEGALASQVFFNPYNWVRLSSGWFSRSDLAAEYYDEHVFAGAKFADMMRAQGPHGVHQRHRHRAGNTHGLHPGCLCTSSVPI